MRWLPLNAAAVLLALRLVSGQNPLDEGNSTAPVRVEASLLFSCCQNPKAWDASDIASQFPNSDYPNGTDTSDPTVAAGSKSGETSPPWYPSPWGEGLGNWSAAYERARSIVSQMNLLEKVNLTTGVGCVKSILVLRCFCGAGFILFFIFIYFILFLQSSTNTIQLGE
jgi:hypothetical protein